MAIVNMKRLRVIAMNDQRDALLKGLLRLGCVEIKEPIDKLTEPSWAALLLRREESRLTERRSELTDVTTVLESVAHFGGLKDGLLIQRKAVEEDVFHSEETLRTAKQTVDRVKALLTERSRLTAEEQELLSRQAALRPWASLQMPLDWAGTANTAFRLAVCPAAEDPGRIRTELEAADAAAEIFEISADTQQRYCLLVYHRQAEEGLLELLRPHGFSLTEFPDMTGPAAENLDRWEARLREIRSALETVEADIAGAAKERDALRLYADRLQAEAARESNTERLLTDGTILFFEGWVPAERLAEVQSLAEKLGCAWSAEDPTEEEYPEVPVQLKNNWLTRPLNMVTEMYSLPAYGSVDPNPLMAPFFILFYGIMMADMGYGLLMILAGLIISNKYRPKGMMGHMFGLITLCGVSTFVMGVLTGGFFGDFLTQAVLLTTGKTFVLPSVITPLEDILMILIGSMALGFVHIVTGMAINVVRKVKRGEVMSAFWEEITWWIVFLGIALAVLGVTSWVLYGGIALVLLGPIVNNQGFGKVTGIFASLYNNVTGYFGDILSYSRLMALMLAGSVIAQVFNTLAAIPGNIVVFVLISLVGNTLNFALNLLGCYVHDLRLQCLEYFGKFYDDGGRPFEPLAIQTKYVDIQ